MKQYFICLLFAIVAACTTNSQFKTMGSVEKFDPSLDNIISSAAKAEVIAEGFEWSEGPLWVEKYKMLLFSDVPKNIVYKWTQEKGKEIYLTPSGYTASLPRVGEMGSNGLLLDKTGKLVLCQHGNRQMARMNSELSDPKPLFTTLAGSYMGKRFNSPNDAVYNSKEELFFTDPPYGLVKNMIDPEKEIPFQGVYKVKKDGTVVLLTDSITRPNGIAFFPGEKKLLVANSDPLKPNWYVFDVAGDSLKNGKIFYNASYREKNWKGLPDGLKIDKNGNVFATGPGGVYIFNSAGKKLGLIRLDEATSNCALSPDEKTIYITNDMYVLRMKMRD
jgi:gluconolactonase